MATMDVIHHSHAAGDGSSQVAHSGLSGLVAGDDHTQYTRRDILTTRGDMYIATAGPVVSRLGVGSAGSVLTADGTDPSWQTNVKIAGYTRVGSASAPNNTTAGDLTAIRAVFGTDVSLSSVQVGVNVSAVGSSTGVSATAALHINNPTVALVGAAVQHAPALRLTGHSWNTGLSSDRQIDWRIQLRTASVSGDLGFSGFSGLFFNTVRTGLAATDRFVITEVGGYLLNGYIGIGTGVADPSNTTAGDLTALRAHIGTDAAFTTGMGFEINAALMTQGGTIATQSFSPVYGALFAPTLTGALVDLVGVGVNPILRPANNPPNWVMGLRSLPMVDPPNAVTVPSAYGWALGLQTGSTAGGAINVTTGVLVSMVYGTQKPATAYGMTISDVGSAGITNAVALNIVKPTGSTNNYYASFDTADATVMAVAGRLPVSVGGVLHYLLYG